MSSQCQELNALHSQSVDGARIKIPDRLLTPPETDIPYIIDTLTEAARRFADGFLSRNVIRAQHTLDKETAEVLMIRLLKGDQHAVTEYEILNLARTLAHKYHLNLARHLLHVDFGALTTQEKYELSTDPYLTPEISPYVWNSLVRSDIVNARDLAVRKLGGPLRLQRLYSSKQSGLPSFFEYLNQALQDFKRRVLLIRVCLDGHTRAYPINF